MASIELVKASDGSGNANVATVQNSRSPGATTIIVDTVLGINPDGFAGSMGTPHTFTDPVTSETITVISEATAVDFTGHIDGGNIEIDDIAPGYVDAGSEVGDIVIIRPTTQYGDNLAEVLETSLDDDGSLNDDAIHSVVPAGVVNPYAGASAPAGWLMCDGASKVRADFADLFAAIGTTFGAADGTHFNVPDLRARTPVGVGAGTFSFTFAAADVTTGTDQITVAANSELITGRKVQIANPGTLPTGISAATDYYIIVVDSTHIKLATSLANAVAGTAIDITAQGSGTNTATGALSTRTLGQKGGEETHALTTAELAAHSHVIQPFNSGAGGGGAPLSSNNTNPGGSPTTNAAGGSTDHNNMQPFLALNYIIKT